MLSLLPALLAAGYLQTMAGLNLDPAGDARQASASVFNMTVHHSAAYHSAASNGFAAGPVSSDVPAPFRSLQTWQSEIVAGADGAFLLTWATASQSDDGIIWSLENAHSLMRRIGPGSDQPARMFGGLYTVDGNGRHFIGGIRVPEPAADIAAGAPVLATRIR